MSRTSEGDRLSDRSAAARRPLYKRLKPGPSKSSAEVAANQRARLRGAMIELVADRGYRRVTVRGLSRTAGVSTGTFYSHFENVEECLFSTCAWFLRDVLRQTLEVPADGRAAVQVRARTLLQALADNPEAAELALIESRAVYAANESAKRPTRGLDRRLLQDLTFSLGTIEVPTGISEAIAAGAMSVARSKLLAGDPGGLHAVADEVGLWALALCEGDLAVLGRGTPAFNGGGGRYPATPLPHEDLRGERDRILSATAKVAMSRGYRGLTIPRIRTEAGVSRRRFNELFASTEESFLATVDGRFSAAVTRARLGVRGGSSWESGLVQMTGGLCREISQDSALARLTFREIYAVGRRGVELVDRLNRRVAECLRKTVPDSLRPSKVFAEASVGAVWGLVDFQIKAGRSRQLLDLSPALAFVLLAPILGGEAAVRVSAP